MTPSPKKPQNSLDSEPYYLVMAGIEKQDLRELANLVIDGPQNTPMQFREFREWVREHRSASAQKRFPSEGDLYRYSRHVLLVARFVLRFFAVWEIPLALAFVKTVAKIHLKPICVKNDAKGRP
jgi:hypothetical protein